MSSLIAVTGAPCSGKTLLSVQLAIAIHEKGEPVFIVFCNGYLPPKSYLCDNDTKIEAVSLGLLLTAPELSNQYLLQSMTAVNDNLAYTGYCAEETVDQYPNVTKTGAARLLELFADFHGTVIFDCTDYAEDIFSQMILQRAEKCIVTLNADCKSAAWHRGRILPKKAITILNNIKRGQATECFDVAFLLYHVSELAEQFETQNLWQRAKDKPFYRGLQEVIESLDNVQNQNV